MNELMQNNTVTLTGRITEDPVYSHSVFSEGFYETFLEVKRLSDQVDIVPITVSERIIADHSLAKDSTVSFEGQFRSYNKLQEGRSKLMLTVFVLDILAYDPDRNPNEVELVGYVCKDPIYRTTPFKREICDLLVAVNRAYNKSDYIPCIAWGRNARFAKNMMTGEKVLLSGRIQSRTYQKMLEDGTTEVRVAYEISVNRIGLAEEEREVQ